MSAPRWTTAAAVAAAVFGVVYFSMVMKDEAARLQRQNYCEENKDRNVEAGEALLHGLPHSRISWSMPAYSVANALVCHPFRGRGGLVFLVAAQWLTAALVAGMGRFAAGGAGGAFALGAYCFFAGSFGGSWESFFSDRWFYQATIALVGFAAAWRAKTGEAAATRAVGLSIGISLATFSPLVLYPAMCAGWGVLRAKERWKAVLTTAALFMAFALLLLSPWIYLNSQVHGRFVFLEYGRADTNIMAGAAGVVSGPVLVNARSLIEASSQDPPLRAAALWVLAHPRGYLCSVLKRIRGALLGSPIPFGLAIAGAALGWRNPVIRSLSGLAVYYCGIHFLMPMERRYLFPILPILAVLSAAGWARFSPAQTCSLWPRKWFIWLGGPVIAVAAFALTLCAVFPARASAPDALERERRLHPTESWLSAYEEPRQHPGNLRGLSPDRANSDNHLEVSSHIERRRRKAELLVDWGISLYRAGRGREAEDAFRGALRQDGNNTSALLSLGTVLAASGRGQESVACYDRILALKSGDPDLAADTLAARANAWQSLGRTQEARLDREAALKTASSSWPWRRETRRALGL